MHVASVSLDEVLRAAAGSAAALVPETAGYLALAIGDAAARLPYRLDDALVSLTTEGTVRVARGRDTVLPEEGARVLRDLLRRLLAASAGTMPGLAKAAAPRIERGGAEAVIAEIEAALIPVNRAAARRSLARLARDTTRAKDAGRMAPAAPPPRPHAEHGEAPPLAASPVVVAPAAHASWSPLGAPLVPPPAPPLAWPPLEPTTPFQPALATSRWQEVAPEPTSRMVLPQPASSAPRELDSAAEREGWSAAPLELGLPCPSEAFAAHDDVATSLDGVFTRDAEDVLDEDLDIECAVEEDPRDAHASAAGTVDAGLAEAAPADAGTADAGTADAGTEAVTLDASPEEQLAEHRPEHAPIAAPAAPADLESATRSLEGALREGRLVVARPAAPAPRFTVTGMPWQAELGPASQSDVDALLSAFRPSDPKHDTTAMRRELKNLVGIDATQLPPRVGERPR